MKTMDGLATNSTAIVKRLRCSTLRPVLPGRPTSAISRESSSTKVHDLGNELLYGVCGRICAEAAVCRELQSLVHRSEGLMNVKLQHKLPICQNACLLPLNILHLCWKQTA